MRICIQDIQVFDSALRTLSASPKLHAPTLAILPIPISTVRQEMAGDNSGKASKISHQGGLALACAQSVLLRP